MAEGKSGNNGTDAKDVPNGTQAQKLKPLDAGTQALAQKPQGGHKRPVQDPIVARVEEDGLFGKAIPKAEDIQKGVGGEIKGPVAVATAALPATLNEKMAKALADQLARNAENMDKVGLRTALKSLLKVGGPEYAATFVDSLMLLVPNATHADRDMLSDYMKKRPDVTCPQAKSVAETNISRLLMFAGSGSDTELYALRVVEIAGRLGDVKDPAAVDAIVGIYKTTDVIPDTNQNGLRIIERKEGIKLACVDALAEMDTEESFGALTQFSDEKDVLVSAKIVEVISKKLGV